MGEDHTGKPFDGLEGYTSARNAARTFGRGQLEGMIREQFDRVDFYYPFPDYKIPSAVLSEAALRDIDVADLVATYPVRDYSDDFRPRLFDDGLVWEELGRNRMASLLAPSFLVVAGNSQSSMPDFEGLGVLYSSARRPEFQTVTMIVRDDLTAVQTIKSRLMGEGPVSLGPLTLQPGTDPWAQAPSLAMLLRRNRRQRSISLGALFAPCHSWFEWLRGEGDAGLDGKVDGRHLDSIWKNAFVRDGRCHFIDQEWLWHEPLSERLFDHSECLPFRQ